MDGGDPEKSKVSSGRRGSRIPKAIAGGFGLLATKNTDK